MNQPTREEFEKLKAEQRELKEEVRQLRERGTEPITIPRIELDPGGIQARLDNQAELLKEISQKQNRFSADVDELKIDAKAYIGDAAIFKNKVEHMEDDVSTLKDDVGTIKTRLDGHAKFFEEHGKRLAATATKDDISRLESDITSIKTTQEQILRLLQQNRPES